ncbi:hypothetical protein FCL49_15735 [Serratia proteamaculans]|nr:hypothetical protein [Serratia proteamaculans]NTZ29539.1 hypothetical protein [Serratia proteamaculans]
MDGKIVGGTCYSVAMISTTAARWFRLLTKQEKTWFFLLCGDQPKINKLIFLVICFSISTRSVTE